MPNLPTNLRDGNGFLWDVRGPKAQISNGTRDAYDEGLNLRSISIDGAEAINVRTVGGNRGEFEFDTDSASELVIPFEQTPGSDTTTVGPTTDIRLERKFFASQIDGFARFMDSVTNDTDSTITVTLTIDSNLGSDGSTNILDSSSGDAAFDENDNWVTSADAPADAQFRFDPVMTHIWQGEGFDVVDVTGFTGRIDDNFAYTVTFDVAAGETRTFAHFASQADTPDDAARVRDFILNPEDLFLAELFATTTQEERDQVVNFDLASLTLPADAPLILNAAPEGEELDGSASGDFLSGNIGVDILNGNGGNDRLVGFQEDDTINGGAGDDFASGGVGADTINGGAGDDTLNGDRGNDAMSGDDGNDTIDGGDGKDTISGGEGDDSISGGDGNDAIQGDIGNDSILGGSGDDTIQGNDGDDDVRGNTGNDTLEGGRGNDTVRGGSGSDRADGGVGNDVVRGGTGSDRLSGGADNDTLFGGRDNDILIGGDGDDRLIGGAGDDIYIGGGGADTFVIKNASPNRFRFGTDTESETTIADFQIGNDVIEISASSPVSAQSFDELIQVPPIETDGGVRLFIDPDTSLLLLGLTEADLTDSMFVFV